MNIAIVFPGSNLPTAFLVVLIAVMAAAILMLLFLRRRNGNASWVKEAVESESPNRR